MTIFIHYASALCSVNACACPAINARSLYGLLTLSIQSHWTRTAMFACISPAFKANREYRLTAYMQDAKRFVFDVAQNYSGSGQIFRNPHASMTCAVGAWWLRMMVMHLKQFNEQRFKPNHRGVEVYLHVNTTPCGANDTLKSIRYRSRYLFIVLSQSQCRCRWSKNAAICDTCFYFQRWPAAAIRTRYRTPDSRPIGRWSAGGRGSAFIAS